MKNTYCTFADMNDDNRNIDLTLMFRDEEVKRCVINCFVWPTFFTKLLYLLIKNIACFNLHQSMVIICLYAVKYDLGSAINISWQ